MALYEEGTFTSIADFLSSLAAFGTANGWSVDTLTTTTLYMTRNGVQARFWYRDSSSIYAAAQVDGVVSPSATIQYLTAGTAYRMYSCGNSLYFWRSSNAAIYGHMVIEDKIGEWSGGVAIGGVYGAYDRFLNDVFYSASSLYRDGVWSGMDTTKSAGDLWGSRGADPIVSAPNRYNMAVVPIPVLLAVYDANTSYLHPIGFAPGVYRTGGGSLYSSGDMLTIGGSTYVVNGEMDLIFKLS